MAATDAAAECAESSLRSPSFCILKKRVEQNCEAMAKKASRLNVSLRPHVKTHKTTEIARLQIDAAVRHGVAVGNGAIVVSTLRVRRSVELGEREYCVADRCSGLEMSK